MTNKLKEVISTKSIIFLVLNYFLGYMYVYPYILSKLYYTFELSNEMYDLISLFVYLFMITISIYFAFPVLKESYHNTPKLKKLIKSVLLTFVALYFFSALSSVLVFILTGLQDSANQNQVVDAFKQNPSLIIFTTIIYAPIVEEIVFRGAIFRGLRSKTNFIISAIISGLLFGFIHVFDSLIQGNILDLLYIIVYGSLGFVFCYAYEKNNSIFASIALHFINNFLGIIGIILSTFTS